MVDSIMGFISGMLISLICFELLPQPFAQWGLYKGIAALLLGVVLSAWLDCQINNLNKGHRTIKSLMYALVLALSMGLAAQGGGFPSGFAWLAKAGVCFSSGVMLYIACENILPESKGLLHSRLPVIGAIFGFITGALLAQKL